MGERVLLGIGYRYLLDRERPSLSAIGYCFRAPRRGYRLLAYRTTPSGANLLTIGYRLSSLFGRIRPSAIELQ